MLPIKSAKKIDIIYGQPHFKYHGYFLQSIKAFLTFFSILRQLQGRTNDAVTLFGVDNYPKPGQTKTNLHELTHYLR